MKRGSGGDLWSGRSGTGVCRNARVRPRSAVGGSPRRAAPTRHKTLSCRGRPPWPPAKPFGFRQCNRSVYHGTRERGHMLGAVGELGLAFGAPRTPAGGAFRWSRTLPLTGGGLV